MKNQNQNQESEPLRLSGQIVAAGQDRKTFKARFVKAGVVRAGGNRESNITIEGQALELAARVGMFDNKAVFVDHAGFFDYPSVRNLAGKTANAEFNITEQAVYGDIAFYSTAGDIAGLLNEILAEGSNAPDIGLSIVFWPLWAERKEGDAKRVITGIKHVESVDIVFEPAADGRILQALSALIENTNGGNPMTEEREIYTAKPASHAGPPIIAAQNSNEELAQMWLPALAKAASAAIIQASGLPQASRERLAGQNFMTPADVDAAIASERTYLAALNEANVIQLSGQAPRGRQIQVGMDGTERIQKALEALLLGVQPPQGIATPHRHSGGLPGALRRL